MAVSQRKQYNSPRQVERQQRILAIARDEISKRGYEGLTMRGLAEASGVALKTLYNLYSSKDELLFAAVGDLLQGLRDLPEVSETEAGIPAALAYVKVLGDTIVREPAYADAMARALFQSAPGTRLVDILLGYGVTVLREALDIAASQAELSPGTDLEAVSHQLAATQWGTVLLWQKGLLELDQVPAALQRGQVDLLLAISGGARRRWLQSLP